MRTSDGGESWQSISIGENEPFFDRIYFTDTVRGWLFARDTAYRTEDVYLYMGLHLKDLQVFKALQLSGLGRRKKRKETKKHVSFYALIRLRLSSI